MDPLGMLAVVLLVAHPGLVVGLGAIMAMAAVMLGAAAAAVEIVVREVAG